MSVLTSPLQMYSCVLKIVFNEELFENEKSMSQFSK